MERAAKTLADVIWRLLDIVAPAEIVEPVATAPAAPVPAKPIETKFSIEVGGLSPNDAKKFVEEQLATVATVHANAVAAQAAAAAPTEPVDTHSGGNPAVLRDMPSESPQALGARLDEPAEDVLTQLQLPLTVTPNGTGEPCAPCDVSIPNNPDLIEDFKETVIDREAGTVTRNGITEPIIEHAPLVGRVEDDLNGETVGVNYSISGMPAEDAAKIEGEIRGVLQEELAKDVARAKETAPAPKTTKKAKPST